jgi:hypothetical protein
VRIWCSDANANVYSLRVRDPVTNLPLGSLILDDFLESKHSLPTEQNRTEQNRKKKKKKPAE